MSIALSTLLFFLLVIPGIALRATFYAGPLTKKNDPASPFDKFISAIIPGFLLQSICVCIVNFFDCIPVTIDFEKLSDVFFGGNKNQLSFLQNELEIILGYNILVTAIGAGIGLLARKIIRWRKYDHKYELCRFNNEWFYRLTGELIFFGDKEQIKAKEKEIKEDNVRIKNYIANELKKEKEGNLSPQERYKRKEERNVYIENWKKPFDTCLINAVVRSSEGKLVIYYGYLYKFITSKGTLDTIELTGVHRRYFADDNVNFAYKIPAFNVILKYSEIVTMSISLNKLRPRKPDNQEALELMAWKEFMDAISPIVISKAENPFATSKKSEINININSTGRPRFYRE